MKKAVLFDIDGTLLNSWDFIFDSVKNSTKVYNLPYPSPEAVKKAIGKPLAEFCEILMPGIDPDLLSQTHREFQKKNYHLIKPFAKTKKTLKNLKKRGFLIAAVSNRIRSSVVDSLKTTKISVFFDVIVCIDDVKNPKPHQEHLLIALEKLDVAPENSYMVGDTDQDILAGKNAKVKTVGVTYGFLGKDIAKHGPDYLIDDISDLLKIL